MKARIIALLLAVILCIGLLAGCGTQTAQSGQSSASEQPAQPTSAPAAEETDAPDQEPDSEPEEASLPLVSEPETFSWFVSYPPIMDNFVETPFDDYLALAEWSKRTNVYIDWYTVSVVAETETFNIMISSEDYTDILKSSLIQDTLDNFIDEEIILDLTDMIKKNMPNYLKLADEKADFRESLGSETDSGRWGVVHTYVENPMLSVGMVVRQDWLDELDLEVPVTYDDYHDVLKAFKTEKGADTALFISNKGLMSNHHLVAGYDTTGWWNTAGAIEYPMYQIDGQVQYGPTTDSFKDYLKMMASWYADGLLSPDFVTYDFTDTNSKNECISNGRTGMWCEKRDNLHEYDDAIEGFDLTPIADARKTAGQQLHFKCISFSDAAVSNGGLCISTSCENPELLLRFFDYTYGEEGMLLMNYGIEHETFEYDENGQPQLNDTVLKSDIPALSLALTVYTGGAFPMIGVIDNSRLFITMTDRQLYALDIWDQNVDDSYLLPSLMTLNTEENEVVNKKLVDITTYVSEMILKFIVGEADIDEKWPEYLSTIEAQGLDEAINAYQSAYDRYMSR